MFDYTEINKRGGFILDTELPALAKADSEKMLLVRCNCGRFIAEAKYIERLTSLIDKNGGKFSDYIRDVSIPAEPRRYMAGVQLSDRHLDSIAEKARLSLVFVQCRGLSFCAPAQDVRHFVKVFGQDEPAVGFYMAC